jgi:hypothetical protein
VGHFRIASSKRFDALSASYTSSITVSRSFKYQFDFEFSHGTAFQKRTSTDGINDVVARAQCMRSWQPHSRSYATTRTDEARRDSAVAGFELSLCDRRRFEPTKIRRGTVSDRLRVGRLSCRISFGGCKPLRTLGAPMARLHRHRRRMVVWALEAQPTNAGHRCPTLLIAGEIAGCWSAIFVVSGAPRWSAIVQMPSGFCRAARRRSGKAKRLASASGPPEPVAPTRN